MKSWVITEAPKFMLSARPRAISLASGPIIVAGGRPALNVWVNQDGNAQKWEAFDIPTVHNHLISEQVLQFCPQFLNANLSLGWIESSAYTQVVALSPTVALVCYERQGASSGYMPLKPPIECSPKGSSIFCMRM